MKIFDYSPIPFDAGKLSFQDRLKGISKFGFSWISEMRSQEIVIRALLRVLDNRFVLLRNIPMPGANTTIPMVLLGPHGFTVLNNSALRGVFRATGETWEVIDNKMRDFITARPNLIKRTLLMTQEFGSFLIQCGYTLEIDGVLIFSDPGIHVNTNRPDVRILLIDAIGRFGSQLLQAEQVFSAEKINQIIDSIHIALQPKDEVDEVTKIVPHQQIAQYVDSGFLRVLEPLQKKMNFSRRQWLLLGAIILIDVLVLVGFVLFILRTA
jgi:hypothetical protein